jgi:hypothetical protein
MRNCFVREEGERLILCAGVPARWLDQAAPIRFGPAPTPFGTVSISLTPDPGNAPRIEWQGNWHRAAPPVEIRLPGFAPVDVTAGSGSMLLVRRESGA